MNGNATCGERVVIVEVDRGHVNLKTGRIASTDSSHGAADNCTTTVVWGDRQFGPAMETPEDAYEKAFHVADIHLLRQSEAESLGNPSMAQDWFGTIYQDGIVVKIQHALKRLQWK